MPNISRGELFVFVYKDGLLSRLGHDLRLRLERFTIEISEGKVIGRFSSDSLHVDTAMRDGVPRPGDLSSKDRQEIEQTIAKRILQVAQYPEVVFEGTVSQEDPSAVSLSGTLTMLGKTQPLTLSVSRRDGVLEAQTTLIPSRWGIKPFKALMGALKIHDRVEVRFQLPDPG